MPGARRILADGLRLAHENARSLFGIWVACRALPQGLSLVLSTAAGLNSDSLGPALQTRDPRILGGGPFLAQRMIARSLGATGAGGGALAGLTINALEFAVTTWTVASLTAYFFALGISEPRADQSR